MGLDTTHDCWCGAYSAFNRWRDKLAEVAGYAFGMVDGRSDTPLIDWGHITDDHLNGDWEKTPDDPLVILIAHYDCDGFIRCRHCAPLADRLEELLPLLPATHDTGHIGDWRKKTQQFINGLRAAHEAGEDVEFH